MASVLLIILEVYVFVLFGRVIFSWIRPDPRTFLGQVNGVLLTLTEPVVGPVRRVMPNLGPFDFSVLVVLLVIQMVLIPLATRL